MAYKIGSKRKFPTGVSKRRVINNSMAIQKLDRKLKAYRRQDTEWTQYQTKTQSPALGNQHIWHLTQISDSVQT